MSQNRSSCDRKIIIAGAGCAGLALAWWLVELGGEAWDIEIIDATLHDPPRKLWSFWGDVPSTAHDVVERTWNQMAIRFPEWSRVEPLRDQPYHSIRSERYVSTLVAKLSRRRNVRFVQDRVHTIHDDAEQDGAMVKTDHGEHRGRFVFQSCLPLGASGKARYPLRQHFGGWEIETEQPQPDSEVVTLMDFSVTPLDEVAFHYVLPLTAHRRLIEYTVFSVQPAAQGVYDEAVKAYIDQRVVGPWRRVHAEYGVIPMEERILGQQYGQNVFNIGAMGGMTKPTTGYTFVRSQHQARHLAETLLCTGRPRPLPPPPRRFRLYDLILLQVLYRRPDVGRQAFSRLFARHRYRDILRFLDENTSLREEVAIFSSMPIGPFLGALARSTPALPALAHAR